MKRRTSKQYARILYELTRSAETTSLPSIIGIFLELLRKERALTRKDVIIEAFRVYAKDMSGVDRLALTVAREFSDKTIRSIERMLGDHVETTVTVDPSIIAGVIVRTPELRIDGSVKMQIERLRTQLAEEVI